MEQLIEFLNTINPTLAAAVTLIVGGIAYWQKEAVQKVWAKVNPFAKSQEEKDFAALNVLYERADRNGCPLFREALDGCWHNFKNKKAPNDAS